MAYPDGHAPSGRDVFGAVAAVFLVAIVGPLIAAGFDRASAAALPAEPPTLSIAGCAQTAPAERSLSAAPGRVLIQHLACDARGVTVRLELFSPRTAPGALVAEERRLVGLSGDLSLSKVLVVHGVSWRLIQTEEPVRTGASALWMNGRQGGGGLRMRLMQGWASIVGSRTAPVVMAVVPDPDPTAQRDGPRRAQQSIAAYLNSQPGLATAVARMSGASTTATPGARTE